MTGTEPAKSIRVDISKARLLTLVVDEAVNGLLDDYANWADARLITRDGTVVYLSDLPNDSEKSIPFDNASVDTSKVRSIENDRVVFDVTVGGKGVPLVFSFLDALGYDLVKERPVLRSYVKIFVE